MNEDFVRRAVEEADLNALRIALFQATGSPDVGDVQLQAINIRAGQRQQLVVAPDRPGASQGAGG